LKAASAWISAFSTVGALAASLTAASLALVHSASSVSCSSRSCITRACDAPISDQSGA
jgi:hypothetical protein